MTRARTGAALAATAALALAGCGGGSSDDARSAVKSYINAFAGGDGNKACSLMTDKTRAQFVARVSVLIKTKDCGKALNQLSKEAGPTVLGALKNAKITKVSVKGDHAIATLTSGKNTTTTLLQKEGGKWKVTAVPGTQ